MVFKYSLHSGGDEDGESTEITNCVIFYKTASDTADFACDHDNICSGATEIKQTSVSHVVQIKTICQLKQFSFVSLSLLLLSDESFL